jgi:hypothetical protein
LVILSPENGHSVAGCAILASFPGMARALP